MTARPSPDPAEMPIQCNDHTQRSLIAPDTDQATFGKIKNSIYKWIHLVWVIYNSIHKFCKSSRDDEGLGGRKIVMKKTGGWIKGRIIKVQDLRWSFYKRHFWCHECVKKIFCQRNCYLIFGKPFWRNVKCTQSKKNAIPDSYSWHIIKLTHHPIYNSAPQNRVRIHLSLSEQSGSYRFISHDVPLHIYVFMTVICSSAGLRWWRLARQFRWREVRWIFYHHFVTSMCENVFSPQQ